MHRPEITDQPPAETEINANQARASSAEVEIAAAEDLIATIIEFQKRHNCLRGAALQALYRKLGYASADALRLAIIEARRLIKKTANALVERNQSIDEFCASEHISRSNYYSMKRTGTGPDELHAGGRRLITPEARKRWRKRHTVRSQPAGTINKEQIEDSGLPPAA